MTAQERALTQALSPLSEAERSTMDDTQVAAVRKTLIYQSALFREQVLDLGRAIAKALTRIV